MELRHLRYFASVAGQLNFRRAAGLLGIAQPALSQQIRSLEEELGVQLLERNRRRVRLTDAGAAFLEKARITLSSATDAIRAAQQADRGEIGRLSVGFVASALYGVFPDIVRLYRERHPRVHIELHELPVVYQAEWLRTGRMNVSFLRPPLEEAGIEVRTILEERWVVAMPASHPLARRGRVSMKSLAGDQFILFPRTLAPNVYDQVLALCHNAGFSPNIVVEAQMQAAVSLAAAGIGLGLVPESLRNLGRKGLVYKPLSDPAATVALAVAWRKDEHSPTVREFLAVVDEVTSAQRRGRGKRVAS